MTKAGRIGTAGMFSALLLALGLSSGAIDDPPPALPTPIAAPQPTPGSAEAALVQQIQRQLVDAVARLEAQARKVHSQVKSEPARVEAPQK